MRYARFMVPVALTAAVLAGCATTPGSSSSSSSPAPSPSPSPTVSAKEIFQNAGEALNKVGSFRMKGDVADSGDKMSIDVKVQGSESYAIISMGGEGSITFLNVGGASYFQADQAFWTKTGGIDAKTYNSVFKGKWVKPKAGDTSMEKLIEFANVKTFLDPADSASVTMGEKTTINGTPAWTLKNSSATTFFIAAEGEPYPLRVETAADEKIDFTEFGAKFDEIKAPPASKVISI